jgi:hypothetical protein
MDLGDEAITVAIANLDTVAGFMGDALYAALIGAGGYAFACQRPKGKTWPAYAETTGLCATRKAYQRKM